MSEKKGKENLSWQILEEKEWAVKQQNYITRVGEIFSSIFDKWSKIVNRARNKFRIHIVSHFFILYLNFWKEEFFFY